MSVNPPAHLRVQPHIHKYICVLVDPADHFQSFTHLSTGFCTFADSFARFQIDLQICKAVCTCANPLACVECNFLQIFSRRVLQNGGLTHLLIRGAYVAAEQAEDEAEQAKRQQAMAKSPQRSGSAAA
jgi:hypothetical protein